MLQSDWLRYSLSIVNRYRVAVGNATRQGFSGEKQCLFFALNFYEVIVNSGFALFFLRTVCCNYLYIINYSNTAVALVWTLLQMADLILLLY